MGWLPARAAFPRLARLVGAVPLVVAACAAPVTAPDLVAATRLEAGGRTDDEALAAWTRIEEQRCGARRAATATAEGTLDRSADEALRKDDCGVALLRRGQLLERLARRPEATVVYESAVREGAGPTNAARALVQAARLREEAGDLDNAVADCQHAIERFPGELGADDALDRRLRLARLRREDPRALRDRLDALAVAQAGTDGEDNLIFAAADLSDGDLHEVAGAVGRWDDLARRFPRSSLRDDALWRAAALLRKSGDPRGALIRLEGILATRRRALVTGSYNSVWLDDALLLHGRILLDDLDDPRSAARDLLALADDYRESVLRDDALFDLARARLALGDAPAACDALARLLREFPDGNHARAAGERRAALRCQGAPPA